MNLESPSFSFGNLPTKLLFKEKRERTEGFVVEMLACGVLFRALVRILMSVCETEREPRGLTGLAVITRWIEC